MRTNTRNAGKISGTRVKLLVVFLALVFAPSICSAADIYIAQSSTGGANGSNCANALAWNAWGNANNWVAGNTLHICGTYSAPSVNTTAIQALGGGSNGNPITIKFEPNAVLTSGAWSGGGAIDCNSKSFITVDGGTNGIIQNTANGDALANQISSAGIVSSSLFCSNTTVRNVKITNLYIKVQGTNDGAMTCGLAGNSVCPSDDSECIGSYGTNSVITHNTVDHCATGIGSGNYSHHDVSFNSIAFAQHGIADGSSNGLVDDISIHDNDIGGGAYLWDNTNHNYHHNGIIIMNEWIAGPNVTNLKIYNNYIHGIWSELPGGGVTTAAIFLDDYPSGKGGQAVGVQEFNNVVVFDPLDTGVANSYLMTSFGGTTLINNTVIASGAGGGTCITATNVPGTVVKNNLCSSKGTPVTLSGAAPNVATIDFNLYYMWLGSGWYAKDQGGFDTFAQWQALGFDLHSMQSQSVSQFNPKLNANGTLGAGSAAVGVGTNLTGLGIMLLDSDKLGMPRSSSGAWAVGAFAASSNPNLNPATGLAGTAH